jgi:5'-3' exonuclease
MTQRHLLLMDASGFAHRAYHALAPVYREQEGEPIGAVLGFLEIGWRMLGAAAADQPTHAAAVFDFPGPTFRHKLSPTYKANRPPARRAELAKQLPIMHSAAEVLGMTALQKEGFEADDIIATLAVRARKAGMRVTIVSSDKDFGQLVVDGAIEIVDPLQKRRMGEADIVKKMGVIPKLVPAVQAIWGDAVDNIIGVPGAGMERASALVRRFGSLEAVLANAKDCRWPAVRHHLVKPEVQERVRLNLKLATLRRNVALDVAPEALVMAPVMKAHLQAILKALGASHHMEALFRLDPKMVRIVPHVAQPWAWWEEELKIPGQRLTEDPQAGFFETTLVKGGPRVQARIWREAELDADGEPTGMDVLRCEIAGKPRDPFAEWVRLSMKPIKRSEYRYQEAMVAYDRTYRPDSPRANPARPIDLLKQPAPRNPKRKTP